MKKYLFLLSVLAVLAGCHDKNDDSEDLLAITQQQLIINPTYTTPLSARFDVRTSVPTKVTITIQGQDGEDLVHTFDEISMSHKIPVLGLYEDYENKVSYKFESLEGQTLVVDQKIKTNKAFDVPFSMDFKTLKPELMSDGFTMLHLYSTKGLSGVAGVYPIMLDKYGKIRWVSLMDMNHIFKPLSNGHYMVDRGGFIAEIDLLGAEYARWYAGIYGVHHDAVQMPSGNILVLTSTKDNPEDGIAEINTNVASIVNHWDTKQILDYSRPQAPDAGPADPGCWLHLNGIDYNANDDSFVVSGRSQSAVAKIDRKTGKLIWILGNHEKWRSQFSQYLLKPQGENFEWQWGQHSPVLHPKEKNRILIYDNGCDKSYDNPVSANNNYSRAVEYLIDEQNKTITQTWQWGKERGATIYTPYIGNAQYTSNDNILICFGGITKNPDGTACETDFNAKNSVCIVEVNKVTGEVAMELVINNPAADNSGYRSYRAYKIPIYQ